MLLPACFNPDDIFPVHGSLISPDPVGGQSVRLLRAPLAQSGSTCSEAIPFKETSADEAGNFSFDVFRAQAQKLTGTGSFCFRAGTSFPSGTSAVSDIQALTGETALQPFPDWRAEPTRADGGVRFEPIVPIPERREGGEWGQVTHRLEFLTEDGGRAWVMDDRVVATGISSTSVIRRPMVLDAFALEDFSGFLQVRARVTGFQGDADPLGFQTPSSMEVVSGSRLALGGTKRPVSRGLPCPPLAIPCPLTDGDLTPVDVSGLRLVRLSLSVPMTLSAVVVRGLETADRQTARSPQVQVVLRGSDGGLISVTGSELQTSQWNAHAERHSERYWEVVSVPEPFYSVVVLEAGVSASVVQVFLGNATRIAEVSVFE